MSPLSVVGPFRLNSSVALKPPNDIVAMTEAILFPMDLEVASMDVVGSRSMHTRGPERITSEIDGRYRTILIHPPWRFANRTGKVGPEHKRLHRFETLSFDEIASLPIPDLSLPKSHLYLWCPNGLLADALGIMKRWRNLRAAVPIGRPGERKRAALYRLPLVPN